MVDLVKLRKKAKKNRDQGSEISDQVGSARESEVGSGESPRQVEVGDRESEIGSSNVPAAVAQQSAPSPKKITARQQTAGRRQPQEVSSSPSTEIAATSSPTPDSRTPTSAETGDASSPTPHSPPPIPSEDKLAHFRETAGKRREGFIEEEAETSASDQVELLTFVLAGEQYAVAIDHIVEIVTPRAATHVPNADRSIVGIMSLRGTIVTIIDVRQKLGHPPAQGSNDTRTIVAERAGETLGFEVDRVLRVLKVGIPSIEPQPVVHSSEKSEAIQGVFRHANALTILLDLDKLLA